MLRNWRFATHTLRKRPGSPARAKFDIVWTLARGPMVINERVDRFTMPNRNINRTGVGVFYLNNCLDFAVKMG